MDENTFVLTEYWKSLSYEELQENPDFRLAVNLSACMVADMDPTEAEFWPAKDQLKMLMDLWRDSLKREQEAQEQCAP